MSSTRLTNSKARTRLRYARFASAAVVVASIGGMLALSPIESPTADAAAPASNLTVKWTGDASSAASYQPARNASSRHFAEFKDIQLSVSQTSGIIDQAIRVSVAGFKGTQPSGQTAIQVDNAKYFLQAMQCWGEDPLADDFRETCQWGGKYGENNGLGTSVYYDNQLRVAGRDMDVRNPTTHDVPFRTVDGAVVSGKNVVVNGVTKYPIRDYFSATTTNEVQSARVGIDGTGFFDFETQSADTAPQLGCGTAGHERCWLVVVPRGTVFGGDGDACSDILDPANNYEPYTAGRANSIQGGSPLNTNCDYWDNRIVIPLDFAPVGSKCAVGSTEVRVIGSQLMLGAMSSWQPSLCQTVKTTFSFATNPDAIARAQVIEPGSNTAGLAYSGYPVSSGELLTADERDTLAKTKLAYTPVAVSSVVIAFLAESSDGRQEQLVVSPRLMAKILTQSFRFLVPSSSDDPDKNAIHLAAVNRSYNFINQDPEFRALNPTNFNQFTATPAVVLPGPAGADAIKQVWRWILADDAAVAFLNGTPDPWGMKVNPYYLPKGDTAAVVPWYLDGDANYTSTPTQRQVGMTNLDGSPQRLSEQVLDTFPKNDESLMPLQLTTQRSRFDSLQFAPYSENLLSAARQTFRADPNSKTFWDPNRINTGGTVGDWISSGAQLPGQKFMIAVTDSVSAKRWGLSVASVLVPDTTTAVAPDADGMRAALAALKPTSLDAVTQVDPAAVPATGYPMTMVTWAAVNLTKSTADSRSKIAAMLTQVTTTGQEPGSGIGELPAGYLPLSDGLKTTAAKSITEITSYVPQSPQSTNGPAQDDYEGGAAFGDDFPSTDSGSGADPTVTGGVDEAAAGRTPAAVTAPIARGGLATALGVGVAGFLFAPFLFRGRGFL